MHECSDKPHLGLVTVNAGRTGGMQKFSRDVIAAALNDGWRVTVALSGDDVYQDFVADPPDRMTVDRVDWVDATFKGDREYRWKRIRDRWRWFADVRPDVVLFVQSSNTPFRASIVGARLAGIPVVTTHRTMPYMKDFVPSHRYCFGLIPGLGLARKRMVARTWLTSALASHVVYNNQNVRRGYEQHYGYSTRKGRVIVNAVDTPATLSRTRYDDRDAVTVGYVGRIGYEKRLDVLLEAMAMVPSHQSVQLKVYGEGPDLPRLESLAVKLRIADRVEWCGVTCDAWSAYEKMDIVVLCSPRESSSNMILEAMAAGCAVTVTDAGGMPELVGCGKYGICVPSLDVTALAGALQQLIENDLLRRQLGQDAQSFVAGHHDLTKVSNAWLELLREATRGRRSQAKSAMFPDVAEVTGPRFTGVEGVGSP
jgi:glycosyltransferase involved in cell wall biosynthesis